MADGPPVPEAVEALRQRRSRRYLLEHLDGSTPVCLRLYHQARLAAKVRTPLLIQGEPGVGKQWLARLVHHRGVTAGLPFVALDCSRLPLSSLTRLFERGEGIRALVGEGTLYLAEPAFLPRDLQRIVCAIAAEDSAAPRLVAGSSGDLGAEVTAGRFLEELYGLLQTQTIALPPLRERTGDLTEFVNRFLERLDDNGLTRPCITAEACEVVKAYGWPGNLAQLEDVLRTAKSRAGRDAIDRVHLPAALRQSAALSQVAAADPLRALPMDELLEQAERRLIRLALRRCQGNKTRAAEVLNIWRARLLRRMEALGISDDQPAHGPTPGLGQNSDQIPIGLPDSDEIPRDEA
jgi:DNA-binding NtrC family response regulator